MSYCKSGCRSGVSSWFFYILPCQKKSSKSTLGKKNCGVPGPRLRFVWVVAAIAMWLPLLGSLMTKLVDPKDGGWKWIHLKWGWSLAWCGFCMVIFRLTTGSMSEHRPKVRGDYTIAGSNHNKPAYKKEQKASFFFFSSDAWIRCSVCAGFSCFLCLWRGENKKDSS